MNIETKLKEIAPNILVILPNGKKIGASNPDVVLYLTKLSQIYHLINRNIEKIASDYVQGDLVIQGSPRMIANIAGDLLNSPFRTNKIKQLSNFIFSKIIHTKKQDKKQIQFHYDISSEFFALWLDTKRVYSCGYFEKDGISLENAQEAKLDLICRKLDLHPGESFLDIGAGWGALLIHAVKNYNVIGTGITLSENQFKYVTELIKKNKLQNKAKIELLDYRNLNNKFNKIASVGMCEHVGTANLNNYFKEVKNLLLPDGLFLNHGITAGGIENTEVQGIGKFIDKYIFPGGELQHLSYIIKSIANTGLEVLDVENLRPHYAKTLWAWSDALEEHLFEAQNIVGQKTVRAFRLYLAGCAVGFEKGWTSIHQILISHHGSLYKFNREYMYKEKFENIWKRFIEIEKDGKNLPVNLLGSVDLYKEKFKKIFKNL